MKAELPFDEAERLSTLHSLGILDTPVSDRFDRLTRTAVKMFGVSAALVSLVDENRQWFKSVCGLDAKETDRDIAFCAHAILGDEILLIPDATQDPRFADNPLVTGPPYIRFYAGAPLFTPDGKKIGTFCLIDKTPRHSFGAEDQNALRDLSELAMDQIMVERFLGKGLGIVANNKDKDVLLPIEDLHQTFVSQSPVPIIMLDHKMRVLARSNNWCALWRMRPSDDQLLSKLTDAYPRVPERWVREIERSLDGGSTGAGEQRVEVADGATHTLYWEVSRWTLSDGANGVFLNVLDVTDNRQAQTAARLVRKNYEAVYRKTPAMMHSISTTGVIVDVSDFWLKKMGYEREEVIGRKSTDFFTPESAKYAKDVVLPEFFKTGMCDNIEYQFVRKDGSIIDVLLTARVERDEHGEIVRSVTVLQEKS